MPNILFNVHTMTIQSKLRSHENVVTRSTERLATGSRINKAKDDPFRNFETHNVNSEIRNAAKAKQNSSDGASLLQIAEGTCNEVQSILQRIRELSVQSATDTITSTERKYMDIEAEQLLHEIDRISAGSTFNSKQIFGEGPDSFSTSTRAGILHIGPGASPGMANDSNEVKVTIPELSANALGLDTLSLTYQGGATKAIDDLDAAISSLGYIRSYMGSLVNRMDHQVEDLETKDINLNDYVAKVRDTDFAQEVTDMTTAQIRMQAAVSILAQSNSRVSRVLDILG